MQVKVFAANVDVEFLEKRVNNFIDELAAGGTHKVNDIKVSTSRVLVVYSPIKPA